MKRKGMTIIEVLVATGAFVIVGTAIALVARTSINTSTTGKDLSSHSNNARIALAQLSADISSSDISTIKRSDCLDSSCVPGSSIIRLKVPVRDDAPIAGTMIDANGRMKLGADGKQNCYYEYKVNPSHQLIRTVGCTEGAYCGDGRCEQTSTTICPSQSTCPPTPLTTIPKEDITCLNMTDCIVCMSDCGYCGDTFCTTGKETASNCLEDCGTCGDGTCNQNTEICGKPGYCAADCPACNSVCGNAVCEQGETNALCPADCP